MSGCTTGVGGGGGGGITLGGGGWSDTVAVPPPPPSPQPAKRLSPAMRMSRFIMVPFYSIEQRGDGWGSWQHPFEVPGVDTRCGPGDEQDQDGQDEEEEQPDFCSDGGTVMCGQHGVLSSQHAGQSQRCAMGVM